MASAEHWDIEQKRWLEQSGLIPRPAVISAGKLLEYRLFDQPFVTKFDGWQFSVSDKPAN